MTQTFILGRWLYYSNVREGLGFFSALVNVIFTPFDCYDEIMNAHMKWVYWGLDNFKSYSGRFTTVPCHLHMW